MKTIYKSNKILLLTTILIMAGSNSFAQSTDKRGQTVMKFLNVSTDARATAMGEAFSSVSSGASSIFYNPAHLAASSSKFNVSGGVAEWVADISYNTLAASYRLGDGKYGVFGFHVFSLDYGSIEEVLALPLEGEDSFELTGAVINPMSLSTGLTYAVNLTSKLSIGATIKYVSEDLGDIAVSRSDGGTVNRESVDANTLAYDFGINYFFGYKSLQFGASFRNFAPDVRFDVESAEMPLLFRIGISMDVLDFTSVDEDTHSLLLAIDTSKPRDFYEQVSVGFEYTFIKRFSVRSGYSFPSDVKGISIGGGISQPLGKNSLNIDYAYTGFGELGNINLFTVQIGI